MSTPAISQLSPKAQAAYKADPQLAATRSAQVAASKGAPAAGSGSTPSVFPAPDLSDWSVPGEGPLEKALIVLGILVLGLGIYSRISGKTINLSLAGFGMGRTPLSQPPLAPTMAGRTAVANPGRVGA